MHAHTPINQWDNTPTPTPTRTHSHARTHARMHARTHTHAHTHTHTHTHTHIYTYTYTHTHTHTHTNTHTQNMIRIGRKFDERTVIDSLCRMNEKRRWWASGEGGWSLQSRGITPTLCRSAVDDATALCVCLRARCRTRCYRFTVRSTTTWK